MTTIITENGRVSVPNSENVIVKASGWVKYQKDGEIHHFPPSEVIRIEESDPPMREGIHGGDERADSSVVYQSPHGKI